MSQRARAPMRGFCLVLTMLCFACGRDSASDRDRGARLTVEVSALTLPGITDASYTISVTNGDGAPVWSETVTSAQFGDRAGSLSYVGPCDASSNPNTVSLVLESLSDAGGVISPDDYQNPTVPNPLSLDVDCADNEDTPVVFNITIMRDAEQGFFDVAVNFDTIFCSAKVDCLDALDDPILFLFHPETGEPDTTLIIATACTAGPDEDTHLYMSDVIITCDGDVSYLLDPSGGPGNIGSSSPLVFQHATYVGNEGLPGAVNKSFWNMAIGLEVPDATQTNCRLSYQVTAADGLFTDGYTPAATTWPYIAADIPVTDGAGELACGRHGLDEDSGLGTTYTSLAGRRFCHYLDGNHPAGPPTLDSFCAAGADITPPTVAMTRPTGGETLSGVQLFSAIASDDSGQVASVTFESTAPVAQTLCTDSGAKASGETFSCSADLSELPEGSATVVAVAYDPSDNSATSDPVVIDVVAGDPGVPEVTITWPPADAALFGDVTLMAEAGDDSGTVVEVEFVILETGTQACIDAEPKSSGSTFSCVFDATSLASGDYTLLAQARDAVPNEGLSLTVPVRVEGPAPAGTIVLTGTLIPPAGATADQYRVANNYGSTTVDPSGHFSLPVGVGTTITFASLIGAGTDDHNALVTITTVVPGAGGAPATMTISPSTTASALVFNEPSIATTAAAQAEAFLAIIDACPETAALADLIDSHWATLTNPLDTPTPPDDVAQTAIQDALVAAMEAAGAKIDAATPLPLAGTALSAGDEDVTLHYVENIRQTNVSVVAPGSIPWNRKIEVKAAFGLPLHTMVNCRVLDLAGDHHWEHCKDLTCTDTAPARPIVIDSLADLLALRNEIGTNVSGSVFPIIETLGDDDGEFEQSTIVGSRSVWSYLKLSTYLDAAVGILESGFSSGIEIITTPGQLQLPDLAPRVYVCKGVTGRFFSDVDPGEFAHVFNHDKSQWGSALVLNIGQLGLDAIALAVGDQLPTQCFDDFFSDLGGKVAAMVLGWATSPSESAVDPVLALFWDIARSGANTAYACFATAVANDLEKRPLTSGFKLLGKVLKFVDLIGKIGTGGGMIDRATALVGGGLSPFSFFSSPQDLFFFVVGDPFSPTIDTVAGAAVGDSDLEPAPSTTGGATVTVGGFRLEDPRTGDPATFRVLDEAGRWRNAKVVGGPAPRAGGGQTVDIEIPADAAGKLRIEASLGESSARTPVVLERIPLLSSITPDALFNTHEGQTIELKGRGLLARHELMVGTVAHSIELDGGTNRARSTLTDSLPPEDPGADMPAGVYAVDVRWRAGEVTAGGPTLVIHDKPVISAVLPGTPPAKIYANSIVTLTGTSLGRSPDEVSVEVSIDGGAPVPAQVIAVSDTAGSLAGEVVVRLPDAGLLGAPPETPDPDLDAEITIETPNHPTMDDDIAVKYAAVDAPAHERELRYDAADCGEADCAEIDVILSIANGDLVPVIDPATPGLEQRWVLTNPDGGDPDSCVCERHPKAGEWFCLPGHPTINCDRTTAESSFPLVERPPKTEAADPAETIGPCTADAATLCAATGSGLSSWDQASHVEIRDTITDPAVDPITLPAAIADKTWGGPNIFHVFDSFKGGGLTVSGAGLEGDGNNNVFFSPITITMGTGEVVRIVEGAKEVAFGGPAPLIIGGKSLAECDVGLLISDATNVVISDIAVFGCKVGIRIVDSTNVTISHGFVAGYSTAGIEITGSTGVQIGDFAFPPLVGTAVPGFVVGTAPVPDSDPTTFATGPDQLKGVVIDGGSRAVTLELATVVGHPTGIGVEVSEASDVSIDVGAVGVQFALHPGPAVVPFADPSFKNATGVAIVPPAGGGLAAKRVEILFSRFFNNDVGLFVAQGDDVSVHDTIFGNADPAAFAVPFGLSATELPPNGIGISVIPAAAGVPLPAINRLEIKANALGNNAAFGIALSGGDIDARIEGNALGALEDPDAAGTANGECGLSLDSVSGVEVVDNELFAEVVGICVDGSSDLTFADNDSMGAIDSGIFVIDSHSLTFTRDMITGTVGAAPFPPGSAAFYIESSDCISLNEVAITDNMGHGLEIAAPPADPCGPIRLETSVPGSVDPLGGRGGALEALLPLDVPDGVEATVMVQRNGSGVTDPDFGHGVYIHDGAPEVTIDRALITENRDGGVMVDDSGGAVTITRSRIGIALDDSPAGNGAGVWATGFDDSAPVAVGGQRAGNVISGNGEGVIVDGAPVSIEGNFIGTNAAGDAAVGNTPGAGVSAMSPVGLAVGGHDPLSGNLISGNGVGVRIFGDVGPTATSVSANLIGTNRTGTGALPNDDGGIFISGCAAVSGGVEVLDNVIAGNDDAGSGGAVALDGCRPDFPVYRVRDNNIGIGAAPGLPSLGNAGAGVLLDDAGSILVHDNDIAHNVGGGIFAVDADACLVQANTIASNFGDGAYLSAGSNDNRLQSNTITSNTGDGVEVTGLSLGNTITQSSISANTLEGIALSAGGNANIQPPVIRYVGSKTTAGGTEWIVGGVVPPGTPNHSLVEVFVDPDDEGLSWLGGGHVADGEFIVQGIVTTYDLSDPSNELHGTLTDLRGNTSEFGPHDPGFISVCPTPAAKDASASSDLIGLVAAVRGTAIHSHSVGGAATAVEQTDAHSPDVCGTEMVYVDTSGTDAELMIVDLTGGSPAALASDAADDGEPAFSPDCSMVAFISDRQGSDDLFVVDVGTGVVTPLTDDAVADRAPGFLDDGTVLWSRKEAGDADRELYSIPVGGGTPSLWRSWTGDDYRPRVSPNGDTIAFTSCDPDVATLCEAIIARTADSEIGALRAKGCIRQDPDWYLAPDGSRFLVFTQRSAIDLVDHVVLANDVGTVLWAITPLGTEDHSPACCLDE